MKDLYELGEEYLNTAEQLKQYVKDIYAQTDRLPLGEYRLIMAKISEFRKTASLLQKYGSYLCKYYKRGNNT